MLRTHYRKYAFSEEKYSSCDYSGLIKCLNRSNNRHCLLTCTPISELPSIISTIAPALPTLIWLLGTMSQCRIKSFSGRISSGIKTSGQERTSFAQFYYSSSSDLIPPAGLKPTLKPVTSWYSLMARHMTSPTARVALTPSLPVLVLMKSEPAIMHTREH